MGHIPVLQSDTSNVKFSHLRLRRPLAMAVRTWPHPESTEVWRVLRAWSWKLMETTRQVPRWGNWCDRQRVSTRSARSSIIPVLQLSYSVGKCCRACPELGA